MCGIAGILREDVDLREQEQLLCQMSDSLRSRGPDDSGRYLEPGAALLHVARTVVRRAERATWAALAEHGESMNPLTATYLNRLSDLLFILARAANLPAGDVTWVPGANRA